MKKFITGKVPLIVVILAFAIFNVIFWPITAQHIKEVQASQWVGYGFLCGAFVITGALTFIPLKSKNNFVATLPVFFTVVAYFGIAFIVNLIFLFIKTNNITPAMVINGVLLLLFLIFLVISYKSFNRTEVNTERREARVKQFRTYAIEVSSIKDVAADDEVKAALAKLQDNINYSSTASNANTVEKEVEFAEKIQRIDGLVNGGAEKEEILKAINDAERILKVRNQILMATK